MNFADDDIIGTGKRMTLYQDLILDHAKHPRNQGRFEHATNKGEATNPTCGDRLSIDIDVRDGTIADIRWEGAGCAISQAAASLLSEHVKAKTVAETRSLKPEDVTSLLGIELSPNRLKCALLSLETLKRALK